MVKFGTDGRYHTNEFESSVNAYPIPSLDGNITLSFDMPNLGELDIKVFSIEGRMILSEVIFVPANTHTELPIQLSENSAAGGMYFLEVRSSEGIYQRKLIVGRQN